MLYTKGTASVELCYYDTPTHYTDRRLTWHTHQVHLNTFHPPWEGPRTTRGERGFDEVWKLDVLCNSKASTKIHICTKLIIRVLLLTIRLVSFFLNNIVEEENLGHIRRVPIPRRREVPISHVISSRTSQTRPVSSNGWDMMEATRLAIIIPKRESHFENQLKVKTAMWFPTLRCPFVFNQHARGTLLACAWQWSRFWNVKSWKDLTSWDRGRSRCIISDWGA